MEVGDMVGYWGALGYMMERPVHRERVLYWMVHGDWYVLGDMGEYGQLSRGRVEHC